MPFQGRGMMVGVRSDCQKLASLAELQMVGLQKVAGISQKIPKALERGTMDLGHRHPQSTEVDILAGRAFRLSES